MKTLLLLLTLSASAMAEIPNCKSYEALVFGGVVQTIKDGQDCFIEIDVETISENPSCPLARVDIELSRIKDDKCEFSLGDEIKHYITQSNKPYLTLSK
jgi:hypothetical protein